MPIATIRANFNQPLDVHGDVFAQITFHAAFVLNGLADAVDLLFIEIMHLFHRLYVGGGKNPPGTRVANAVDISQRDVHVFVTREIYACNTSHVLVS